MVKKDADSIRIRNNGRLAKTDAENLHHSAILLVILLKITLFGFLLLRFGVE